MTRNGIRRRLRGNPIRRILHITSSVVPPKKRSKAVSFDVENNCGLVEQDTAVLGTSNKAKDSCEIWGKSKL